MIHYVPICFILAILGTLLVNPVFYYQLFTKPKEYRKALKEYEDAIKEGKCPCPIKKSDYCVFDISPIKLIIGQLILFILVFLFSSLVLYFGGAVVVRWSTILAYLWIPAISQIINWVILSVINTSFAYVIKDSIVNTLLILCVIFIIIPTIIGIHKGVYNYLYPYEHITFMSKEYAEYPTVDEVSLLDKANLAAGSSLKEPIYRNGNWIYPVVNDSSHVTSSGYLVVDSTGKNIHFVAKEIKYSPWIISTNNTDLVARRALPSAVLFGNSSFQIEPVTGDIYFCKFYGDYAFFRAGRKVEGAILVNSTTGEYTCYPMSKIPDWVTGISF